MKRRTYSVTGADGQTYGPVDLATLREWVLSGAVTAQTPILEDGTGRRLAASELPELKRLFTEPASASTSRRPPALSAGLACLGVFVLVLAGLGVAINAVQHMPATGASAAQPVQWSYTFHGEGHDTIWDADGVTVIVRDAPSRMTMSGLIPISGEGERDHDGGRSGLSTAYRDGVTTIGFGGRFFRIEDGGSRLVSGGRTFDLTQGKIVVELLPDGDARMHDPLASVPRSEYEAARQSVKLWADGDQAGAMALAEGYLPKYPESQRLTFFLGACTRSCFDLEGAAPFLTRAVELGPQTAQGRCAAHVLAIDRGQEVETEFAALRRVAYERPEDPLLLWMLAVECRHLKRNEEGVQHYALLLKRVGKGSSLVHQTYANLLDAVGRHKEALPHRYQAVQLEPAKWSLEGLAITLNELGHYAAADQATSMARMGDFRPLGPAAALKFTEKERQRIALDELKLDLRLRRERKAKRLSGSEPEFVALRKRHGVTEDQMAEIRNEALWKGWGSALRD